ncbi:hypothetical protein Glove_396g46 [Diversispora epigaea]|uniref:Uncharacterized protein n=1 Tax=Diversispora epigaea TaxID=1348612 RepID=A0A397H176_9GLOM|nr:hypothetical protein Glove_396g46 [Diversispora epigaea]
MIYSHHSEKDLGEEKNKPSTTIEWLLRVGFRTAHCHCWEYQKSAIKNNKNAMLSNRHINNKHVAIILPFHIQGTCYIVSLIHLAQTEIFKSQH